MRTLLKSVIMTPVLFGLSSAATNAAMVTFPIEGTVERIGSPGDVRSFQGTFSYDSAASPDFTVGTEFAQYINNAVPGGTLDGSIEFNFGGVDYSGGLTVIMGNDDTALGNFVGAPGTPVDAIGLVSALNGSDGSSVTAFDALLASTDLSTFGSTELPTSLSLAPFALFNGVDIDLKLPGGETLKFTGDLTVVPVPAAGVLLATGLAALALARRSRRVA